MQKLLSKEMTKQRINRIGKTNDTLTGRGGLALLVHYLSGIGIYSLLERFFGGIKKSKKGIAVANIFKIAISLFYGRNILFFNPI